jgi:hypothetical protein
MATRFQPTDAVRRIRSRIHHPIVDADGHLLEFVPLVLDIAAEVAGRQVAERIRAWLAGATDSFASRFVPARVFWALPEQNTLDRMTATLPQLLYRRSEELGLDFVMLYPSVGLTILALPDDEVRRAAARALNVYYAEAYADTRDRLEPVAVVPMFTPEEALEELDFAVGHLGLRAIVSSGVIPRTSDCDGSPRQWIDTLGHGSRYDYDPVWARCVELGVVPAFHGIGYPWGSRHSATNYVYNHIGNFAAAQEAVCRSLFLGGVPRRFPGLRFAFLEGGVAWGCQLLGDLIGHFEKRNREAVRLFDPRRFDLEAARALLDEFARGRIADRAKPYLEGAAAMKAAPASADPRVYDDFADSLVTKPEEIVEVFERSFHFGCESDDPMNALAFDRRLVPRGAKLNAMFGSDIGHWDVPDMRAVLPEAFELVDRGRLDAEAFREFTFGNVVRMFTAMNPDFFERTTVASAVRGAASSRRGV